VDGSSENVGSASVAAKASGHELGAVATRARSDSSDDRWAAIEPDVLLPVEEVWPVSDPVPMAAAVMTHRPKEDGDEG